MVCCCRIGRYRPCSVRTIPLSPLNSAAAPGIVSLTVGDGIVEIPPQEAAACTTTMSPSSSMREEILALSSRPRIIFTSIQNCIRMPLGAIWNAFINLERDDEENPL